MEWNKYTKLVWAIFTVTRKPLALTDRLHRTIFNQPQTVFNTLGLKSHSMNTTQIHHRASSMFLHWTNTSIMSPLYVILDWVPVSVSSVAPDVPAWSIFTDVSIALLLLIPLQNNMSTVSIFLPLTQSGEAESLSNLPPFEQATERCLECDSTNFHVQCFYTS